MQEARLERPLFKIYKDLMVTKRDLIDLRESITQTILDIRQSDRTFRRANQKRKVCQKCKKALNPAEGHACGARGEVVRCPVCEQGFRDSREMD
jgi:RNase P subunit RPR2